MRSFSTLKVCVSIFGQMNIGKKAACKMLVKLTIQNDERTDANTRLFGLDQIDDENSDDKQVTCFEMNHLKAVFNCAHFYSI